MQTKLVVQFEQKLLKITFEFNATIFADKRK